MEDRPSKDEYAANEIQQLRTKFLTIDTNFRNALRKSFEDSMPPFGQTGKKQTGTDQEQTGPDKTN